MRLAIEILNASSSVLKAARLLTLNLVTVSVNVKR
uniref:Uncharacterized protein n=1 Tax=Brassica oleracea TaxID=3712 RepID=A0A3P6H6X7_BRAOL|nr:unnamed protein product [Brassica oleracea]